MQKSKQANKKEKEIFKNTPPHREKKMRDRRIEKWSDRKRKHETLTGGCCQWRGSGSFDSDVHIETFVLREKFSGKIATDQQPPNR